MDEIEKCFREHWDEFVKRLSRRCVNVADAEDVVAEAFKRAIQYRDSYTKDKQSIHIWIFSIVMNAYHDYIADLFRKGTTVPAVDLHIEGYERDFEGIATAEQIVKEIDRVPDGNLKDVLGAYFILGMNPREIVMVYPVNVRFVRNGVFRFKEDVIARFKLGADT